MVEYCFHCGDEIKDRIVFDEKSFCCSGCKTVYEIFSESDLTSYYDIEKSPGASPKETEGKFDFLSNQKIVDKLLEFNDGNTQIISLYIPHIHCSSCIWILENLYKLKPEINASQVDFPKKTVRITYNSEKISLQELVKFLAGSGMNPISVSRIMKPGRRGAGLCFTRKWPRNVIEIQLRIDPDEDHTVALEVLSESIRGSSFEKLSDSLIDQYNDGCMFIFYRDNVVLEYGGGAIGPQCFPGYNRNDKKGNRG